MLLSEAIRLGAMLRPQAFGFLFHDGNSCAIGASLEASGICGYVGESWMPIGWSGVLGKMYPILVSREVDPPDGAKIHSATKDPRVWDIIVDLNNPPNGWTRERIAAWVATVEPKEPVAEPQPQHAELVEA